MYAAVDFSMKKSKKINGSKYSEELSLGSTLCDEAPNFSDKYAAIDFNQEKARKSTDNKEEESEISQLTNPTNKDLLNNKGGLLNQDASGGCPKNYYCKNSASKIITCALLTLFVVGTLTVVIFMAVIINLSNKISVMEKKFETLQKNSNNLQNESQNIHQKFSIVDEKFGLSLLDLNLSAIYINDSLDALSQKVDVLIFQNFYCIDIARLNFSYASGNYIVRSSPGTLKSVFCEFNRTFGGNSTGWMRVAELDINNCPPGLRHEITNSVNTCVVIKDNPGCTEINYPVYNTQYTQITGQIRGYQIRSSDGFDPKNEMSMSRRPDFTDLNDNYLDGVSISTNGEHVWSFAAGCNCLNTNNKPTIISHDYTCDGIRGERNVNELLWASQQCGRNSAWFYKVLSPTTTDIKVRICRDQVRTDEDLAIKILELYIQ